MLDIPAAGNNAGKTLPNADFYFNTLNEEPYAFSNINQWGCYTEPSRIDGYFVENNPNEFGIILGHEFSPFIYRGQNKDYPHFVPTANRYDLQKEEGRLKHCVDWIKKKEFLNLFTQTPYYKRCEQFKVLNCKFKFDLEAIAQHYDFMSNYLDISRELLTAMFFAYTYQKDGEYYPITDFEKYCPTLYIGNLKKIYNKYPSDLKIIGFQSVLRPFLQKAMAIKIEKEDKIRPLFEKIELPKSVAFSNEIFYSYNNGQKIFPKDYTYGIAKEIRFDKRLYGNYIKEYCTKFGYDFDSYILLLTKSGYQLTNKTWEVPDWLEYKINREIDDFILPFLWNSIGFRGCCKNINVATKDA